MSIVKEVNYLAKKITGEDPKKRTINEALDYIADYLKGTDNNEKVISKNIKIIADNYQKGGSGTDLSEYINFEIATANDLIKKLPNIIIDNEEGEASSFFANFNELTEVGDITATNIWSFDYMFKNCKKLVTVSNIDMSAGEGFESMFEDCISLTNIPQFYAPLSDILDNMFKNCPSLSDTSLNNILGFLSNCENYSGEKTLSTIGLSEAQSNKCITLSNWETASNSGWTTGY